MDKQHWPSWRYGPKGEAAVFESADDVPTGWLDHPAKHKTAEPAKADETPDVKEPKTRAPAKRKSKAGRKPKVAPPLDL